jgi:hypothetical protein
MKMDIFRSYILKIKHTINHDGTILKQFCEKYLKKYKINSDGTIDVNGNVYLDNRLGDMEKLPVKFGKVSGDFDCSMNILTTLEGCPNYVEDFFSCDDNKLATLEHCPKYIGGDFVSDILTYHILGNVQRNIYYIRQRIVI